MPQLEDLVVDGRSVARIEVAATFTSRLRGLMLRRRLPEGLLLAPERSVHGAGMREPLDVALLGADGTVLRTVVLHPWRATGPAPGARAVLEAPVGAFARWGVRAGAQVRVGAWPGP
ncbi:DUF192 domain-containing protein [Georgenia ruanii]|uniref:DUF192 domain-containing protein n=1 Tax=Georgenia ruanii TaxID=348442 RepID=A0A7J9USW0_9MICO|nr:DUF192 domain-containing protein [Georgenia ruanii]MPV87433.1 DUF192 domain-containing protein [Georgenia ruanii]